MHKDKIWRRTEKRVGLITDKLGKGVDQGILSVVVGLNALGVCTSASCEGHARWGTGGPYVDIEAKETKARVELQKQYRAMLKQKTLSDARAIQRRKMAQRIDRYNQREIKKLFPLLSKFYARRVVGYDQRLTIRPWSWSIGRLESQGVCILPLLVRTERLRRLKMYQAEMRNFAQFVKNEFYKK